MDIKAIINLMAFEIKAQLKTKAFWLLAILPPLALIAMFWLNTTNTVSNDIYLINTTNIPINIESTDHLIIKNVGSDFQCSKKIVLMPLLQYLIMGKVILCALLINIG